MNRKTIKKLKLAFWNRYDIPAACAYACITQVEFERNMKPNSAFYWKMKQAQLFPTYMANKTWIDAIKNGDSRAAMAYLERREPERYDLAYMRKFGKASDE
ncbi:hypothetical protein A3A67_00890 [Candidatus Peribacteria bacterium RIFCSPLOWO2_01_FULL_51_18]|nr:MAG: hypothetical protein A3A67_00890 [Candidatus Peribacteria bacterium RIFCSPLOWO2_01_FULL_51_18]